MPDSVRQPTRERVFAAAQEIGFYGLGTIAHVTKEGRKRHKLGVLLQQGNRVFYRNLGHAIRTAATEYGPDIVDLSLEHLDDLSPENIAARLHALSDTCESIALVAQQHPLVADAIDAVLKKGVPVTGLIAPLSAQGNVGYVGLDGWKVGRTAAWAFDKINHTPGKIGILLGNHRYRNQEMNEIGFRSYFREHGSGFTLLEPHSTYESAAAGRQIVEDLFHQHPDLCGVFISGGGITGALAALKEAKRRPDFVAVGYELFDATRAALIDGTLSMVISHPIDTLAKEAITTLIRAKNTNPEAGAQTVTLGFDIYTSENV